MFYWNSFLFQIARIQDKTKCFFQSFHLSLCLVIYVFSFLCSCLSPEPSSISKKWKISSADVWTGRHISLGDKCQGSFGCKMFGLLLMEHWDSPKAGTRKRVSRPSNGSQQVHAPPSPVAPSCTITCPAVPLEGKMKSLNISEHQICLCSGFSFKQKFTEFLFYLNIFHSTLK